jgi:ferric-dicitrate binding protein FerR (iron transport regulator)
MSDKQRESDSDRMVAKLIETAGRGPTATDDAKQRIYSEVKAEWLRAIEPAPRHERPSSARPRTARLPVWLLPSLPIAAAIVLVMFVTLMVLRPVPEQAAPMATVVKTIGAVELRRAENDSGAPLSPESGTVYVGDRIVAGPDGAASILLDGEVSLRIGADSVVILASTDDIEVRYGVVYLDTGEELSPARALAVNTPFGSVTHIGTQYEVSVNDERLRIRIREGAVSYDRGNGRDSFVAETGQQLLVSDGNAPVPTSIPTTGEAWRWVEELASAPSGEQHSVLELLRWITRETGRELSFENEALRSAAEATVLRGAAGLTPSETLTVIDSTTDVRYRLDPERLLVY